MMDAFAIVNEELRSALSNSAANDEQSPKIIASAENIEQQLRALISIEDLRATGAFFTGDILADLLVDSFPKKIKSDSIIVDPACGVGNLLIAASKKLPIFPTIEETLDFWGQSLRGVDLHPEFIECTKLRLIYQAILRGVKKSNTALEELEEKFLFIRTGDALEQVGVFDNATHILLNPPFQQQRITERKNWGGGKISSAALFMDTVMQQATVETTVAAILPEVLRSGSRYSVWRASVSKKISMSLKMLGRFDALTDVDVFLFFGKITGKAQKSRSSWTGSAIHKGLIVGDHFRAQVGPLVSYRDKDEGTERPFIYAKLLSGKHEMRSGFPLRKTKCKLVKAPFVVVNRTSSPSDRRRAVATLISGLDEIAVENHLVILKPKKGGQRSCRKLLRVLADKNTDVFLNERIRCRHLTIDAVISIPWIDS